ncbi:hypothetical protein ASG40_03990 [Methylobacterium sp. Leaf399]|uniref:hypothetical protein n=1 Tax=Methylobacterium sp. Leaf399 TaxID=1736364 RepID=UPI0006F66A42|nr:hypothetical protein [Methylobacterium sp. Leaf399]KQT19969.1 hypothetical protein ASG40_03990 [Methylobacterium sp. Leaf399]
MRTLPTLLAATLALVSGTAFAAELQANRSSTIDLGTFRGSAYYTAEKGGYRVVATLAAVNSGSDIPQVVRMVTTLNPDQTVHLSVPGALGADGRDATVAFSRRGDRVEVAAADIAND